MPKIKIVIIALILTAALLSAHAAAAKNVVIISGVSEATSKAQTSYLLLYKGIKETLNEEKIVPKFLSAELDDAPDASAKADEN